MSVFEDLIEELKEENLIEETVIETSRQEDDFVALTGDVVKTEIASANQTTQVSESRNEAEDLQKTPGNSNAVISDEPQQPSDNAEFYRKQALDEVAFLKMVEAAFAGVERDQLKIVPIHFDDLEVKKVLHSYLQVAGNANAPEHSKAEFQLLQETESWYSSLSLRDNRILTAHLRRYCETSRPPLSSPALIALARFYRNSPYSEQIRSKFDLVLTRLFSKEIENNRREMVFSCDELVAHIQELYAEWSSIPLYSTETNDAEISRTANQFDDFIKEADKADSFDELINKNFFDRLRSFKESTNENFYAPLVAAIGIECNIRIGNRYVELLEKEKGNIANIENKYGLSHDNAISEATGKTLTLIELLKHKNVAPKPVEVKPDRVKPAKVKHAAAEPKSKEEAKKPEKAQEVKNGSVKSKKWIIALATLVFVVIIGIYFAKKSSPVEVKETSTAANLNLDNSMFKEYMLEASIQNASLKGVVLPTWNDLTAEKKKNVLKQVLNFGVDKGYKKVQLVDKDGKTVGTAADGNVLLME